ncbi:MAG: CBS domain-containing protein [Alphaproteobacteria bacterium]|nr:CBS domain-containing protein [Alphaproteobacteria bacterium]
MTETPSATGAPKVADYMARRLITLTPEMDVIKAMGILLDKGLSAAPVIDEKGRLIGILSKKDCLRVAFTATYHQEWGGRVEDYMTGEVETIDAEVDIVTAAKQFLDGTHRVFPVLRGGRLAGMISRHDILKALSEQWRG